MSIIHQIFSKLSEIAIGMISSLGYFGILILMAMESTVVPLPSELVLPFAGYLAFQGVFNIYLVCIIATFGTVLGSVFSYYLGKYGGEPILEKYGKYVLVSKSDLKKTHEFFRRYGQKTIFFSRFIPVVRHLISVPAGIAEMDMKKFLIYTFLGGLVWNSILAYFGYVLGKNWELVHKYTEPFSYVMVGVIIIAIIYFVYRHIYKK